MVHLSLPEETYLSLAEHLGESGDSSGTTRWVLHRDISSDALAALCRAIQGFSTD